jgi:abequosyltransferase
MKTPRLSILIPTHNRARYIGATLDSIIPQLTGETELVVVDGASTDDTETVLRAYVKRCPALRYIRLAEKGGVDRDYDLGVQSARGDYCWLFTDDDLLRDGAITAILNAIEHDHDVIIVNYDVWNQDFSRLLQARTIAADCDRVYAPGDDERFFGDIAPALTFIGSVILRRSLWLARRRAPYYGTEFIHIGALFQARLAGSEFVIAKPYVSIRYGNASWTGRTFAIWMFKWPALIWSFTAYSETARAAVSPREPWRNLRILFSYRATGAYSTTEYKRYLIERRTSSWWQLRARAIAALPGMIANVAWLEYLKLRHGQVGIPEVDLRNSRFYPPKVWSSRRR